MPNAYEIDFLRVGENSKSGDAIAIRLGDYENGIWKNQQVIVIDGGNAASGKAMVEHIRKYYHTNKVSRVFLTHTDIDHAYGLRTVMEEMEVGKIWMHRPWNHWPDLKDSIKDGRITKSSFTERMREAYQYAHDLEQIALKKAIPIVAPHQGMSYVIGDSPILTVLGPGKEFYLSLIQSSEKTPPMEIQERLSKGYTEVETTTEFEDMSFATEHLGEDGDYVTSCENNMSLVTLFQVGTDKILFTGDAGTMGLYKAIYYAIENGIDLKTLTAYQVPHHGSRRNLSKGILDHIYAPSAFISCSAKGAPKHPSPIVINALLRRHTASYTTQEGDLMWRSSNLPMRPDWYSAVPASFTTWVEVPKD
ncbi:ComEC/Rec2 family competence protein [Dinghuibacter silviterrae]|uniref:Beta-lactamase superfamily II metal-dependent hydrolase n=1 Tax=Dinghuibacter silviterrae TaxID=1539049 RepID=A0A4R8DHV1_9BACT|nr:MBL fold metallo-hydrolase [Dinghuibacter silviterrae]TDW97117.1 beta-lactamase superfamily II metal-dependent hydrolase [Dinghuibacter silviterrae]